MTAAVGLITTPAFSKAFILASAVPEPEEYAALSALTLVGFGLWRRRFAANRGPLATTETSEFR